MSTNRDLPLLGDMLDYCRRVMLKTASISRADFDQDDNLQLAVTYLIQIIGEAAGRVSGETYSLHPEVDWPNIVSLRNRIVHDYSGLAIGRIWDVATIDVPQLVLTLESFMPSDPP
ncbi:MAG TPA: HepT-like ribonuclease domain-containing protein [Thermoanaerobaculia bacterium]|jgi:uncharacterized protein with HEPN domain|nr:HepT-like ribonuclease domain-containing protein [Thermoanaerobaculia bacterium]